MRDDVKDTRRFETHGEWCAYLSSRGHLDRAHLACVGSPKCVNPDTAIMVRRLERDRERRRAN